jgi:hypothetical protein
MRLLSDQAIEDRCVRAYGRAQALARNENYLRDIDVLRKLGTCFGVDGFPDVDHVVSREVSEFCHRVRERAGLVIPVLPDALIILTVDQIFATWDTNPIFRDLPGWKTTIKPSPRRRPTRGRHQQSTEGQALELVEPGDVPEGRAPRLGESSRFFMPSASKVKRLLRVQPVTDVKLGKRYRGTAQDECWTVYDMKKAGMRPNEIMKKLWPGELQRDRERRKETLDKTPLQQRVHHRFTQAERLIRAAYPECQIPTSSRRR